jgi:hypothetical protein
MVRTPTVEQKDSSNFEKSERTSIYPGQNQWQKFWGGGNSSPPTQRKIHHLSEIEAYPKMVKNSQI